MGDGRHSLNAVDDADNHQPIKSPVNEDVSAQLLVNVIYYTEESFDTTIAG